jgi:hypothetical protein
MAGEQTQEIAAADASFLIGICVLGRIDLLEAMFDRVYVAAAVWDEVASMPCKQGASTSTKD